MKTEKTAANIVIAQTYGHALENIRSRRNPKSKNQVSYFSRTADVVNEVLTKPIDIVVTGQLFYDSDLSDDPLLSMITMIRDGAELGIDGAVERHIRPHIHGPRTGTELSEEIYRIKPEILTFRYSLSPEERGKLVGDINKCGPTEELTDFIDNSDLAEILQDKDWDRLEETFPRIDFYKGWKEEHK